jgi:hypothetical protein
LEAKISALKLFVAEFPGRSLAAGSRLLLGGLFFEAVFLN